MTKKDWIMHMLNGGKGTSDLCHYDNFIYYDFETNRFKYEKGGTCDINSHHSELEAYVEEDTFMYPMWFISTSGDGKVVRFDSLEKGQIIDGFNTGQKLYKHLSSWIPHTNRTHWIRIPEPKHSRDWQG